MKCVADEDDVLAGLARETNAWRAGKYGSQDKLTYSFCLPSWPCQGPRAVSGPKLVKGDHAL
jgi:hypothetical protein